MKLHTVITLQLHCNCDTLHALHIDITLYTVITLKLRYIAGATQAKTFCEFYLRRETHYVKNVCWKAIKMHPKVNRGKKRGALRGCKAQISLKKSRKQIAGGRSGAPALFSLERSDMWNRRASNSGLASLHETLLFPIGMSTT